MNKAIGTTEIGTTETDESLEVEIGNNVQTLMDLVAERSRREVENLIDELHGLRKKLGNDRERIQSAIARHSKLSQEVMQRMYRDRVVEFGALALTTVAAAVAIITYVSMLF